jgi:hypothetical protein
MKKLLGGLAFTTLLIGCITAKSDPTPVQVNETIPAVYHQDSSQVSQPRPWGSYCCDEYGYRRCMLDYPAPIFSGCFCRGQGPGYVCM